MKAILITLDGKEVVTDIDENTSVVGAVVQVNNYGATARAFVYRRVAKKLPVFEEVVVAYTHEFDNTSPSGFALAKLAEIEFDQRSRPFRDGVEKWARSHGYGFCSGYVKDEKVWRYDLTDYDVFVEILEDSSLITVKNRGIVKTTKSVKGLQMLLAKC